MRNTAGGLEGAVSPLPGLCTGPAGGAGGETPKALKILHFTLPKIVKISALI